MFKVPKNTKIGLYEFFFFKVRFSVSYKGNLRELQIVFTFFQSTNPKWK